MVIVQTEAGVHIVLSVGDTPQLWQSYQGLLHADGLSADDPVPEFDINHPENLLPQ